MFLSRDLFRFAGGRKTFGWNGSNGILVRPGHRRNKTATEDKSTLKAIFTVLITAKPIIYIENKYQRLIITILNYWPILKFLMHSHQYAAVNHLKLHERNNLVLLSIQPRFNWRMKSPALIYTPTSRYTLGNHYWNEEYVTPFEIDRDRRTHTTNSILRRCVCLYR